MLNEDQYMERTPDLVAKVRKMREAAEKEMNRDLVSEGQPIDFLLREISDSQQQGEIALQRVFQ